MFPSLLTQQLILHLDHWSQYPERDLAFAHMPALRDLYIALTDDCQDVDMTSLLQLTSLAMRINDSPNLPLPRLGLRRLTALVTLTIESEMLESSALHLLPSLAEVSGSFVVMPEAGSGVQAWSVRHLTCTDLCSGASEVLSMAYTFPRLASLVLTTKYHDSLSDGDVSALQLWPAGAAGHMLQLKSLACYQGLGLYCASLARCAVNLEELSVQRMWHWHEQAACSLAMLSRFSDRLQVLRLGWVRNASDADVSTMSGSWLHLHELHLSNSDVTDAGLGGLSQVPALRQLVLTRCPRVTVVGIKQLAMQWSMEGIKVPGCNLIGVEEMKALQAEVGRPQLDLDYED